MKSEFLKRLPDIKTFVFAFEGVLTAANWLMDEQGNIAVKINAKDIRTITAALNAGYNIFFLAESTKDHERIAQLFPSGNLNVFLPEHQKALTEYLQAKNIDLATVLIMIADIQHFDLLREEVLTCCPFDAIPDVFSAAHYVSPFKGGEGCIREILEKALKVHGDWK